MRFTLSDTVSDEAVVEAWRRGGEPRENAFRWLHERFARELANTFRHSMRLDPETCQDLVQETFLQLDRSLESFRHEASLRTWIHTVGRRVALKHLRSLRAAKRKADVVSLDTHRSTEEHTPPLDIADEAPDAHRRVEAKDRYRDLREAIARLDPRDQPIAKFHLHDLTRVRIAHLAGKPVGTVKSTIFRVQKKLRRELKTAGWDPPGLEEDQE